ncbi:MAG: DUF3800 domain-containing protein [Firmicutes bacterium]|nr:DUF3800 domain-containing protein [Bacillota bacterium]
MAVYKLLLDESGNFDNRNERYIIIGGVLFDEKNQEKLEKIFIPLHKHVCNVFGCKELHGSKNKELYKYVASIVGAIDEISPVIFVVDKKKSFIFDKYDKKSFKYNKAIEHLINKMLNDGLIKQKDKLYIKIDKINLNKLEQHNLHTYLPNQFDFVKEVVEEDSRNSICLQIADLIVNRFSKKTRCKLSSIEVKMLNPKIYCFLSETIDDYLKE